MKSLSTLFVLGWIAAQAWAQNAPLDPPPLPATVPYLPTSPAQWINSAPIPTSLLKDKAVVFWFFEEQCPRCEREWPGMLETAQKYQGKPVMFVAVNSGTSRSEVEQYVRRNKITWPVIVDPDRSFERASGVREISLKNIHQARVLKGDGSFATGSTTDIRFVADAGLETAKWHLDPAEIPESLRAVWQQVEFGNYPAAAQSLKKNLNSGREEVRLGAEKLLAVVESELAASLAAASSAKDSGKTWIAYKEYSEIPARFKGFEISEDVLKEIKLLKADEAVKREIAAARAFESLRSKSANGKLPLNTIRSQLEKLLEAYPDTDAAEAVKEAITNMDSASGASPSVNGE